MEKILILKMQALKLSYSRDYNTIVSVAASIPTLCQFYSFLSHDTIRTSLYTKESILLRETLKNGRECILIKLIKNKTRSKICTY